MLSDRSKVLNDIRSQSYIRGGDVVLNRSGYEAAAVSRLFGSKNKETLRRFDAALQDLERHGLIGMTKSAVVFEDEKQLQLTAEEIGVGNRFNHVVQAVQGLGTLPSQEYSWFQRNPQEVFESGVLYGSYDKAMVFSVISQKPTLYVHAMRRDCLDALCANNSNNGKIDDKVLCDVVVDGKLVPFNPSVGPVKKKNGNYMVGSVPYLVLAKGLNPYKMHLRNNGGFEGESVSMSTTKEVRAAINKYMSLVC